MKSLKKKHNTMAVESDDNGYCPTMTVDTKQLPDIDGAKVGDTGEMTVKYKVTGINAFKNGDTSYQLDLTHAEIETPEEDQAEGDEENEAE